MVFFVQMPPNIFSDHNHIEDVLALLDSCDDRSPFSCLKSGGLACQHFQVTPEMLVELSDISFFIALFNKITHEKDLCILNEYINILLLDRRLGSLLLAGGPSGLLTLSFAPFGRSGREILAEILLLTVLGAACG